MLCGQREQHELVLPPVQLNSTDAPQLAAAVAHTLEAHVFHSSLPEFLEKAARTYGSLNFSLVADCASANLKFIRHFLSYVQAEGAERGLLVTATFAPCMLHQLARIPTMKMSLQGVSAPLFSVTRLMQ